MQDDEIYDKYIKPKENIDGLSADYLKNLKKVLDIGLDRLITNLEIRANQFEPQVSQPSEPKSEKFIVSYFFTNPDKSYSVGSCDFERTPDEIIDGQKYFQEKIKEHVKAEQLTIISIYKL